MIQATARAGVVPNSAPPSIGRFRSRCGGGNRIRGGVGIVYLRRVFAEIQVVLFTCLRREVTETEPAENAPCLFY